jgi:hypothetical protein
MTLYLATLLLKKQLNQIIALLSKRVNLKSKSIQEKSFKKEIDQQENLWKKRYKNNNQLNYLICFQKKMNRIINLNNFFKKANSNNQKIFNTIQGCNTIKSILKNKILKGHILMPKKNKKD